MKEFYENFKNCLIIALCVTGVFFLLSGFCFFMIKIDETKIEETRFCPSCGIDLVK